MTFPSPRELTAAAVAKSLQSSPTLCSPIDGSPPGSPVPGILQARTLEWVAISSSNIWEWKVKVKSLSRVRLLATSWTATYQAPPSMGFSRQEYWSGVPLPSPKLGLSPCKYLVYFWFIFTPLYLQVLKSESQVFTKIPSLGWALEGPWIPILVPKEPWNYRKLFSFSQLPFFPYIPSFSDATFEAEVLNNAPISHLNLSKNNVSCRVQNHSNVHIIPPEFTYILSVIKDFLYLRLKIQMQ